MFRITLVVTLFISLTGQVHGSYEECLQKYGPIPLIDASVTSTPTKAPVTSTPTKAPVTSTPTKAPVTSTPTKAPVTSTPTYSPVFSPIYVPVPKPVECDQYTNIGSTIYLNNKLADTLNTNFDTETAEMAASRLTGVMPPQDPENIEANYDPVTDAFCFNEDYPVPKLSSTQQNSLYLDYKTEFDKVLLFTTDVSLENNNVTNERIPGMFLRMCFHDNSIDPNQPEFQTYVASSIDPTSKKWLAEKRYMRTSGADASNLICPEERFHPNNNYDQTASRVLRSIQTSLKTKYKDMSYADLLHNGCNAATIYLTGLDATKSLSKNPFTFGRKDACHVDQKCAERYPLCGPTELLPGVSLSANDVTSWFTTRGMSECLFMGLMWTHTTVDNMASLCPIKKLTCKAAAEDVTAFKNKNKLYFKAGDKLDYFSFFLGRGTHETLPDTGEDGKPNCFWNVKNRYIDWPMTSIDCTLGLSQVDTTGPKAIADVIRNFAHNRTYSRNNILLCALNVLSGKGGVEAGACKQVIPTECKSNANHKFGGFYSTLYPTANKRRRALVDPICQQYGW